MFRYLENVRNGTVEAKCLMSAESTLRSYSMELSKYCDVDQIHGAGVNSIDVDTIEGRYMLSANANGVIVIHDLDNLTGKPEYTCRVICKVDRHHKKSHKFSVETVQWSPIDTGMFTSSDLEGLLKIWDTNTLKRVGEFKLQKRIYQHHMSSATSVHNLIAVARTTAHVTLVDLKSGSCIHELRGHSGTVMCVKWSPNQEFLLASGSCDNSLLLWDIRTPKSVLHRFDPHNKANASARCSTAHSGRVNGLVFDPDGFSLLSYGTDSNLFSWSLLTGEKNTINFGKIENDSRKTIKFDISKNSDPSVVYVPCQGKICAYEMKSGTEVSKLLGHFNTVNCCVVHPLYPELYSGANDHNILVWNANHEQNDAYSDHLNAKHPKNEVSSTKITTSVRRNVTSDSWSDED